MHVRSKVYGNLIEDGKGNRTRSLISFSNGLLHEPPFKMRSAEVMMIWPVLV